MTERILTAVPRALALALVVGALPAVAEEPPAERSVPEWYCLSSAMHLMRMGEDALDGNPDDERVMHRRGLLYEWRQRLAAGEPPCEVYHEIFEAAGDYF